MMNTLNGSIHMYWYPRRLQRACLKIWFLLKSQENRYFQKERIRVCLDPRELNEALVREPYYTWTADELTTMFHGVQYFCIFDMKKGFWQVRWHPDTQMYTAMSLPSGRYVWTRLTVGLVVTRDEFQKKLDAVYNGKPGVTGLTDDMIITGKSEEEHNHNFPNFLKITRSNHLRLNGEILQF